MIAVVDYGVGNLFSLRCSLERVGAEVAVTSDPDALRRAARIVLPGVGAFGDAAAKLRASGLDELIIAEANAGKPLLGICLGMQLLLERSYEYGEHRGLGLISGEVRRIEPRSDEFKLPQIGWNSLRFEGEKHPIFRGVDAGDCVYFVHSYHGVGCGENRIATTDHGAVVTAAVARENVVGVQFHPEKSGKVGLNILRAFCVL